MSNDNLNKPIHERNFRPSPTSNLYGSLSDTTIITAPINDTMLTTDSVGEGIFSGKVVGIVTENSTISTSNIGSNTSVPFAYIVHIKELCPMMPEANQNSAIYKDYVKSLATSGFIFRVAPSQSHELAHINDHAEVGFDDVNTRTGGFYVGNVSATRGSLPIIIQGTGQAFNASASGPQHVNLAAVQPRVGNDITDNIYVFGDSQTGGMRGVMPKYFAQAKKMASFFYSYYNGGGYNILNEGQKGRAAIKKYTYNPGDTIIIGSIGGNRSYDAREKYPNGKTITSQSFKNFASALQTYQNAGVKVIIFGLPYGGDLSRQADREYYDTVLAKSLAPYGLQYISVMQGSKGLKPNNNDVHYGRSEASGYNAYFETLIRPTLDGVI